jgi:hypothetical protein
VKVRRFLREEYPDIIIVISNVIIALDDMGYFNKAVLMKKEVLEKRRRILGREPLG